MRTAISDDFIPLIAISLGAVMSATVTISLLLPEATPPAVEWTVVAPQPVVGLRPIVLPRLAVPPRPVVVLGRVVRPRPVVDFAIIREYGETMVGPEGARTGWNPAGTDRLPEGMIRGRWR